MILQLNVLTRILLELGTYIMDMNWRYEEEAPLLALPKTSYMGLVGPSINHMYVINYRHELTDVPGPTHAPSGSTLCTAIFGMN